MVEYHPISTGDQSRLHEFGKKVLFGKVLGCALIAAGFWKEDPLTADLEELEKMNASEIHPRRVNANEALSSQNREEFVFPIADGTSKISGGDYEFREPTLGREQTVRSEESNKDSRRIGRAQPTELTDDAVARKEKTFGRFKVTSFVVIRLNLVFNSMYRRKRHSPFHCSILT